MDYHERRALLERAEELAKTLSGKPLRELASLLIQVLYDMSFSLEQLENPEDY